jgi:putative SOS response-associated peptidase YedK
MKTLQNIYIRSKALITREQNRQLEQFHKKMVVSLKLIIIIVQ